MPDAPEGPLESTAHLLERARQGDAAARERLFTRVLPPLRRWAHQRLPRGARDLHDSEDLVQLTMLRGFERLEDFESRGTGAFLGYLRQILLNAVRDEARRVSRRPGRATLHADLAEAGPSVLEEVLGRDALARYEQALARMPEAEREAVILRAELGFSHVEIAEALGRPSADAARMLVARALVRLAEGMREPA